MRTTYVEAVKSSAMPSACLRKDSWSATPPIALVMNAPAKAVGTDAHISSPASRRLGLPTFQCTEAPTDLLTEAATRSFATAAVGLTPRKISAGVISAPPPMPVRPTTMPTAKLTSRTARALVLRRSVTRHLQRRVRR